MDMINSDYEQSEIQKAKVYKLMGSVFLMKAKHLLNTPAHSQAREDLEQVRSSLRKAYEVLNVHRRSESVDFVSIFGDYAKYHESKGEIVAAIKCMKKQLRMAKKYLPFNYTKHDDYFDELVHLYKSHNMGDKVIDFGRKILKKIERDFGKNHPRTIRIMISLGYYNRACKALFDINNINEKTTALCMNRLDGTEMIRVSRKIFRIHPLDEQSIKTCLNNIVQPGKHSKSSIRLLERWYSYLQLNYPKTDIRIAHVLRALTVGYINIGQNEKALKYLFQSLQIFRYHSDRHWMRANEDLRMHLDQQLIDWHHVADIRCEENWEIGIIFPYLQFYSQVPCKLETNTLTEQTSYFRNPYGFKIRNTYLHHGTNDFRNLRQM